MSDPATSPQREPDDWLTAVAGSGEMGPMGQYVLERNDTVVSGSAG